MAHGTYDNPRAGNNGSKDRMRKLTDKIKSGKQHRAEKRTRKSELISERGRKTGKQLHKVEYASDKQKQKAQKRTKASEEMSAKGIEVTKRGYAKRRQVEKSGSLDAGDYKKTKTIYTKGGKKKRTKTVTQTTPIQKIGFHDGKAIVKVEHERFGKINAGKSSPMYKRKSSEPGVEAVKKAVLGAGALGMSSLFFTTKKSSPPIRNKP